MANSKSGPQTALISVICADRVGLISSITGLLFELGINLGDTTFAVLGGAAEFTTLGEVPDHLSLGQVEAELTGLTALKGAKISVAPFAYEAVHAESGHITHRIELAGEDSPGLIARLAEAIGGYGANIVRLNSERVPGGSHFHYVTRLAIWIPPDKATACLATIANTAGSMHLTCKWQAV